MGVGLSHEGGSQNFWSTTISRMLINSSVSIIILDPTPWKKGRRFLENAVICTVSQSQWDYSHFISLCKCRLLYVQREYLLFPSFPVLQIVESSFLQLRHAREILWTSKQRFIEILPLHFIFSFSSTERGDK